MNTKEQTLQRDVFEKDWIMSSNCINLSTLDSELK